MRACVKKCAGYYLVSEENEREKGRTESSFTFVYVSSDLNFKDLSCITF